MTEEATVTHDADLVNIQKEPIVDALGEISAELVDDRSLVDIDGDQLGHGVFVDELERLVRAVNPPTNVAVFAPWGSGKSSLCNLLKQRFDKDDKSKIRFVKFDAFKFAETSLSRHFLSQIAKQTEVDDKNKRFSSQLYEKRQTRSIDPSSKFVKRTVGWAIATFALVFLLVIGAALLASHLKGNDGASTGTVVGDWVKTYMTIWGPAVAIVAIFGNAAVQKFTATYEISAPSDKEEFATRFEELAKKIDTKKLVIFVDELDRCSPKEVVATLETLKTFLDIPPCVFVVAADRRVLDHALHESVRQSTPSNRSNPYYSAGSAYIDKIFQYQMELPPLRQRSLVEFADQLVSGRAGVWQTLNDEDRVYLLSVLIPSHVVNPRRAKVLVNAFTLTYRQLILRAREERFGKEGEARLGRRLTEIAKFVALRSEFPLFATELNTDERLVPLVLTADAAEGTIPADERERLPERVADLAEQFARGELPSAELIVRATEEVEEGDEGRSDASDLRKAQGRQLVAYLKKTQNIDGPQPDLIYLASVGADFKLDDADARLLSLAARDGDEASAREVFDRLDGQERLEAARYLAWQASDLTGIEQENAALTAIGMYGRFAKELEPVANQLVEQIAPLQLGTNAPLARQYLKPALILARDSSRPYASDLQMGVVQSEAFSTSDSAVSEAMRQYPDAIATVRRYAIAGFARLLWQDGLDHEENRESKAVLSIQAWLKLPPENIESVLSELMKQLGPNFKPPDREGSEAGPVIVQIFDVLSDAAEDAGDNDLTERLFGAALDVARLRDDRGQVEEMLAELDEDSLIENPHTVRAILNALMLAPIVEWQGPLRSIDPEAAAAANVGEPLGELLADVIRTRLDGLIDDDQVRTVLDVVQRQISVGVEIAEGKVRSAIVESTGGDPASGNDPAGWADRQSVSDQLAAEFAARGALDPEWVASNALISTAQAIESGESFGDGERLRAIAAERLSEFGQKANERSLQELGNAASGGEWMDRDDSLMIELFVEGAMKGRDDNYEVRLRQSEVTETAIAYGETFKQGIDIWIREFAEDPDSIWSMIKPIRDVLDESTFGALRAFIARTQADLNAPLRIARPMLQADEQLPIELFRSISLGGANQASIMAELVRKAGTVDTAAAATYILQLCEVRGSLSSASGTRLARELYPTLLDHLAAQAIDPIIQISEPLKSVPVAERDELRTRILAATEPQQIPMVEAKLEEAWPPAPPPKRSRNPLRRLTGGSDDS